jgi:hypothetical protein
MAIAQAPVSHRVEGFAERAAPVAAATSALILAAAAVSATLGGPSPSLEVAVAGGIALLAVLGLALARYDAVVLLGVLLLGVVFVEPAPPDAIFAIAIAVALVTGRFRLDRIPLGIGALLGAFLALNLLSAVFAVDPGRAGKFFLITFYLAVFGVWLTSYVDSFARGRLLVLALLWGAGATALLGTLSPFVSFPGGDVLHSGGRVKGLFEDPNVFGPFMVVPAVIVAGELLEPRLLRMRPAFKAALFVLFGAGVLFAFSRAAWLNAAVAFATMLIVYALRRGGGTKAFYLLIAFVSAVAVLAVALAVTGSVDFLEERARFQTYDVQRFGAQRSGVELAARYPFGIGPGQFEDFVTISAHSLYVRALAEQGVLGLVVVVAIVIATLAFATANAVAGRDTYGVGSAPLLAAWAGIVVNSAFVDTVHWRHFWLVAGLIWAGTMRPVRRRTERMRE